MSEFIKNLHTELESRLVLMKREDYVFPPRLNKFDWFGVFFLIFICLLIIVATLFYCSAL